MKMFVDVALCAAHGRCAVVAPQVYDLDDDGYNVAAGGNVEVPAGLESAARNGGKACPESAIHAVDDGE